MSSSYEEKVIKILHGARVKFEREKTFKDLKNGRYRYDFYIPSSNIIIEVDGQQHYFEIRGRAALKKQQEHDRQKNAYALARGLKLYRIPYWDFDDNKIQTTFDLFNSKYLVTSKWHNDRLQVPKR